MYNKSNESKSYDNNGNTTYHPCYRTCEYPAKPRVCEYEFIAEWTLSLSGYCFDCPFKQDHCDLQNCVPLNGHSRTVVVINKTSPGPSIQVCEGDTIRVKVTNHLQDHGGISIHWHGMHQYGTNWMDGVSMITQCPIPHATSFVYDYLANPAGTHWWHGHSGFYRADGMYGSLIIRRPKQKEKNQHLYDLDLAEHSMILTDWSLYSGLSSYLSQVDSSELPHATQQTILINGKGRGREFIDNNGNIVYTPRAIFHVKPGLRYRFRVISNAIAACNMQVSIDGHFIVIIATDGSDVRPIKVDSFIITSGERYDFLIAASVVPWTYLIRVAGLSNTCNYTGEALLCYRDAPCANPTSQSIPPWPINNLFSSFPNEHYINKNSKLEVLHLFDTYALDEVDPALDTVDSMHYFMLSFASKTVFGKTNDMSFNVSVPKINGVGFLIPQTPVLLKRPQNICEPHLNRTLVQHCTNANCYCTNIVKLKLGKVVEFVIPNLVSNFLKIDHPVHIHGQAARIVGLGIFDGYPETLEDVIRQDKAGNITRISSKDAVVKDTVIVPHNGYVIMRWKTTNPGIWFFHCHIENHLEDGMAMVIQVGEDDEIPNPPEDFPTCGPWPTST